MARRLLPEAAYDFFAYDNRDGEEGEVRDTLKEAQADVKAWRKTLDVWRRPVIEVCWRHNERKILALLKCRDTDSAPTNTTPTGSDTKP